MVVALAKKELKGKVFRAIQEPPFLPRFHNIKENIREMTLLEGQESGWKKDT